MGRIAPRIAVYCDGELTIHAASTGFGDYDTLCGLDANDTAIGHRPATAPASSPINCAACHALWSTAVRYSAKDFT